MLKKTIKYTDFNGVEREEEFFFNLTKAELMEMELGKIGGLAQRIRKIIATENTPEIQKIFKDIILKAYGEKSDDGRRFVKVDNEGHSLSLEFSQTEAYSVLYMELVTDANAASEFIKGIIPNDIDLNKVEMPLNTKSENIVEKDFAIANNVINAPIELTPDSVVPGTINQIKQDTNLKSLGE